jgi:DNA-binding beta-propeller fold protein YncE
MQTAISGNPFGVVTSPDERWSFVTLNSDVAVFADRGLTPKLTSTFRVPGTPAGAALSHDGRYLLVADHSGALVINAGRAEAGAPNPVIGTLSAPSGDGAIETALSADDRFAFVTLETSNKLAVFNLRRALAHGFQGSAFIGFVPLGTAPVGVTVSPDGHWVYATSETASGHVGGGTRPGTLTMINAKEAETDPAHSVLTTTRAGCSPVRVITSSDGNTLWVAARGSDLVMAFSAAKLRHDPAHAREVSIPVGEAPVGLALVNAGKQLVVADSNRFSLPGATSNLAIVDTTQALGGGRGLVGYVAAGGFPREMSVLPRHALLLVSNFGSDSLEVVGTQSLS